VDRQDPLLGALGAEVVRLSTNRSFAEALQSPSVDPGKSLSAAIEPPDGDGDPVVGVWDGDGTRCAGLLPWRTAGRVAAALDQGVDVELLAFGEMRTASEDRRVALDILVSLPVTVRVDHDPRVPVLRPNRPARRRVVLFADESGDVRWWDAAAESGPADVGELPVSQELRRELKKLRKAYSKLERSSDELLEGYDLMESDWQRGALAQEGIRLWRRARQELGRQFAVGYLGPGMDSPAWTPGELPGSEDESDYDEDVFS